MGNCDRSNMKSLSKMIFWLICNKMWTIAFTLKRTWGSRSITVSLKVIEIIFLWTETCTENVVAIFHCGILLFLPRFDQTVKKQQQPPQIEFICWTIIQKLNKHRFLWCTYLVLSLKIVYFLSIWNCWSLDCFGKNGITLEHFFLSDKLDDHKIVEKKNGINVN